MDERMAFRREIKARATIERGYGRRASVVYIGYYQDGPYTYRFRVSQPREIERLPSCKMGVVISYERLRQENLFEGSDLPQPSPDIVGAKRKEKAA